MQYFEEKDNFICLTADYCEAYMPIEHFDENSKFATDLGSIVRCLGIFHIGFFNGDKLVEMRLLKIPTWVELQVYDYDTRNILLPNMNEETPCRVYKFHKGNKIIPSTVIEDSDNILVYLKFLVGGKIPRSVPYEDALSLWQENQNLNGANLGVPSIIEEMILSVLYRNKNNPAQKFCKLVGENPTKYKNDFMSVNLRQICQYASTFTALTFEDIDSMITTSLNRTKNKQPEAFSPVEDIIKM